MVRSLTALFLVIALGGCSAGSVDEVARSLLGGRPGGDDAVGLVVTADAFAPVFVCTGTLITPEVVLTAAHCVFDTVPATIGFAASHSAAAITADDIVTARAIYTHPLYQGVDETHTGVGQANDIGVMILERAIADVAPAKLAPSDRVLTRGEVVTMVGAGSVSEGGGEDGEMHTGTASITEVGDFELETGEPGDVEGCVGDSGGPLFLDQRVVGVISHARDLQSVCRRGTISTRVSSYLDFIEQHATLPCGSADRPPCDEVDGGSATTDAASSDDGGGGGSGGVGGGGGSVPREDDGGCAVASASPLPFLSCLALFTLFMKRRRSGPFF